MLVLTEDDDVLSLSQLMPLVGTEDAGFARLVLGSRDMQASCFEEEREALREIAKELVSEGEVRACFTTHHSSTTTCRFSKHMLLVVALILGYACTGLVRRCRKGTWWSWRKPSAIWMRG